MKKIVGAALRRGLFCALFVMLTGTVAFAAETAKEADKKDKPLTKDGQITSLSFDKKSGNTTVVLMLGTLNMPEPPKGKPGDMQAPDQNKAAPSSPDKTAEGKNPAGKMPEIIKLNGTTMDLLLTKDTKIRFGMPGMGNGQMPPPPQNKNNSNADNKAGKDLKDNQKAPPAQTVNVSDLKINDVLEVIYAKDGKTVDSILVVSPFPPIGLDGRAGPMMGMRMGRHAHHGNGCSCCCCCGCDDREMDECPDFMMMPPPFPPMMPPCDDNDAEEAPVPDTQSADTAAM